LRIFKVTLLSLLAVVLLGCNEKTDELAKVSISIGAKFGKINRDFSKKYQDEELLTLFQQAIATAVKDEGIVNMASPEYDVQIVDKAGNKYGYHLWLVDKGQNSSLMHVEDTHTIYTLSEEFTGKLIALVRESERGQIVGLFDGLIGNASEVNLEKLQEEVHDLLIPNETVKNAYKIIRISIFEPTVIMKRT